jgi:hypothetical protein
VYLRSPLSEKLESIAREDDFGLVICVFAYGSLRGAAMTNEVH